MLFPGGDIVSAMNILDRVLALLGTAQVQAALIAALVALIVSRFATLRDRHARRVKRSESLLEIYYPIQTFLLDNSLYRYVALNKNILKTNRGNLSTDILPLIDEALQKYVSDPAESISLGGSPVNPKVNESREALARIENRLRPLLENEIKRLKAIVEKEA